MGWIRPDRPEEDFRKHGTEISSSIEEEKIEEYFDKVSDYNFSLMPLPFRMKFPVSLKEGIFFFSLSGGRIYFSSLRKQAGRLQRVAACVDLFHFVLQRTKSVLSRVCTN